MTTPTLSFLTFLPSAVKVYLYFHIHQLQGGEEKGKRKAQGTLTNQCKVAWHELELSEIGCFLRK